MTQNLFDMSDNEYKLFHKVEKLRQKIKLRTDELNIQPAHTDKEHFYQYQGIKYPSVTGRLQILKDPGLMNWKMNRALETVREKWKPEQGYSQELIDAILVEAKATPQLEFEGAGSIGTRIHDYRQRNFQAMIDGHFGVWYVIDGESTVQSGCRAVRKFIEETKYQPLACEFYLADDKLGIGGTGDDFGILNGKQTFLDVKSSNIGDKDSYFYQVALYVLMFERLYGIRVQDTKILHVSKTDGTYKLIDIPDIRKRIKESKQIIKVSSFLESLRQEKKKVPIII